MVSAVLLAACRRGDRRAFEELVELTHRRVYSLAFRLTGDRTEAEDVSQEAYLRMFRGLAGFREEARFETWMHSEPEDVPVPDPTAPAFAERDSLSRALAELPEGQRVSVLLKDVYGLSCREIGEELGIEEGAVKVRLHRGRKRLRELLDEPDRRANQV
jgi:RNA polymerase sigma-70 factor (ECF subfamily)